MVSTERFTPQEIFRQIDEGLANNLPPYQRSSPVERSSEMQNAAFGKDYPTVTEDEIEDIIALVRSLRPWVRERGEDVSESRGDTDDIHESYLAHGTKNGIRYAMRYNPGPWEQSAGWGREQYSKFSVEYEDEERNIDFNLNFDESYYLRIKNKKTDTEDFLVEQKKRRLMSRQEHAVLMDLVLKIAPFVVPPELF